MKCIERTSHVWCTLATRVNLWTARAGDGRRARTAAGGDGGGGRDVN